MIGLSSYSVGVVSLAFYAGITLTQSHSSVTIDDNTANTSNIYLSQINRIDPSNSSQEFFHQGREKLYFLSDEEPEPILQIEEAVEQEGQKPKPHLDRRQETGVNHKSPELDQDDSDQEELLDQKF